jgi:hypothetical protein
VRRLREVEGGLEKFREVEVVEVVEEFFEKNHASKFIKPIILGCRSNIVGLGQGYSFDYNKGF